MRISAVKKISVEALPAYSKKYKDEPRRMVENSPALVEWSFLAIRKVSPRQIKKKMNPIVPMVKSLTGKYLKTMAMRIELRGKKLAGQDWPG